MSVSMLSAAFSNEAVKAHAEEIQNDIKGYLVNKDWIEAHEPNLLKQAGEGFIIIGERVALVDNFSPTGEVRGYVVMDAVVISRFIAIFERLKINAKLLSQNLLTTHQPKQLPPQSSEEIKE